MVKPRQTADVSSLVGTVLYALRKKHGWTQHEVSGRTGIARSSLASIEQGLNDPSWSTVLKLSKLFGVEVGEFAKDPGVRKPIKRGRPWD